MISLRDYAEFRNRVKHREASSDHLDVIPRSQHNISRKSIADSALKVLYRLSRSGHRACLVGGGVRDLLLGIQPKDFDVATDATLMAANYRAVSLDEARRLAEAERGRARLRSFLGD